MQHIIGQDRTQMEFISLDSQINSDNPVYIIDQFVRVLELDKLGFLVNTIKSERRQSHNSKLLLKIYIYGYLNGIRSSRKLERECIRNT